MKNKAWLYRHARVSVCKIVLKAKACTMTTAIAVAETREPGVPMLLACGSGGNRFMTLVAECAALRNRMAPGEDWCCACGVSAGALLAALVGTIPIGSLDEFNARFHRAKCQFENGDESSPFHSWIQFSPGFVNAVYALLWNKPSLFQGNKEFIRKEMQQHELETSGRRVQIGYFDEELQRYRTADSKWHDFKTLRDAVTASCAIPVVMPPNPVSGHRARDGGVAHTIPCDEIIRWVESYRGRTRVHVDLLLSDGLDSPPRPSARATVVNAALDLSNSIVWLNLQRDLRALCSRLLCDTPGDLESVVMRLRNGQTRFFSRPWGTMRVVAPVDLTPRRAVRTSFRVPDKKITDYLTRRGEEAVRRACLRRNKL